MARRNDEKTRVMIVNDSFYAKGILGDLITSSPTMELAGAANDGQDALEKIERINPDVVLLDLEMPKMDGLTFIDQVMARSPVPIVICSSYAGGNSERGTEIIFDSLDAGAVDFIPLDRSAFSPGSKENQQILYRIEQAAKATPRAKSIYTSVHGRNTVGNSSYNQTVRHQHRYREREKVVVIGASTGGPKVLTKIFSELPGDLPASVLVVQHMPKGFTKSLAKHLQLVSDFVVEEAHEGQKLVPGRAVVAPGGYHMVVTGSRQVTLDSSEKRHGVRPSINMTMLSASNAYGPSTIGVLLSGMGSDGAFGLSVVKRRGGKTLAQDRETSVIFGMASAAAELRAVDTLVPDHAVARTIVQAVGMEA